LAEHRPDTIVGAFGIPYEHARVKERGLLARGETVGALEIQEIPVITFREPLLSTLERPLRPSVIALDGLGYVDAAELFERVLEDARPKDTVPGSGECVRDGRDMRANRLRLR